MPCLPGERDFTFATTSTLSPFCENVTVPVTCVPLFGCNVATATWLPLEHAAADSVSMAMAISRCMSAASSTVEISAHDGDQPPRMQLPPWPGRGALGTL